MTETDRLPFLIYKWNTATADHDYRRALNKEQIIKLEANCMLLEANFVIISGYKC